MLKNKTLIGISTFNNYQYTKLALESIGRYTDLTKHRVIVIDNMSTDETRDNLLKDFPFVSKIVDLEYDCIATMWNMFIDMLEPEEMFCMVPNDIIVGESWLEYLIEDLNKFNDKFICISPYMPVDNQYDDVINQGFAERYLTEYRGKLNNKTSYETLHQYIKELYIDWEQFSLSFSERNKNENCLDCSNTHIVLYRNELFTKYNFRFDERYCPYWGSLEHDTNCQLNNLGLFRLTSSRTYVHHFISVTHRSFESDKQKQIYKNTIKLLQKWEWIPGSTVFANIPAPSNIPNWRTPYHKFKLRETELSFEEAKKVPGTKYMSFQALEPGHSYYEQVQPSSIISVRGKSYKVVVNNDYRFYCSDINMPELGSNIVVRYSDNPNIDYYWRSEEENYHGTGHMDFILEEK